MAKILTQSAFFKLVLLQDGSCYLLNTAETEQEALWIPQIGVTNACIMNYQFLIQSKDGLFHGQIHKIEEKI